jgi:murein L,D-transpeptidase YafK
VTDDEELGQTPRLMRRARRVGAVLILAGILACAPAAAAEEATRTTTDLMLQGAIDDLRRGANERALHTLDGLVKRYPNFRLAHLVRGDLLLARVQPIEALGNSGDAARERLEELRAEAKARMRAEIELPPAGRVPRYLLQSDPNQTSAIVVDTARSRVYVYEVKGATPRLVRDFYTTIGKRGIEKEREGDRKTPIGVYEVTTWIPGNKLPDLYGKGAFPIDYPNPRDRLLGRTGFGIWIHGVPSDTYARAPLASDGCVALANPDLESLATRVRPGATPVIIAREVEWVTPAQLQLERNAFLAQLEAWRRDWESRDTERYLAHYAVGFRSNGKDLDGWKAHKHRVNAGKAWIKVALEDVSVFRDPGGKDLISVTFNQAYRSSNLSQRTRKRQYWTLEGEHWKIAYEAPIHAQVLKLPESYPAAKAAAAPK